VKPQKAKLRTKVVGGPIKKSDDLTCGWLLLSDRKLYSLPSMTRVKESYKVPPHSQSLPLTRKHTAEPFK
jgi:hypothetical protein